MPAPLGQHFLRDPAILDRIVEALDPRSDDVVVEIGAGEGTLTRRLAPRVDRVVAIEKDHALAERLRGLGGEERSAPCPDNVQVVQGDALELDWRRSIAPPPPRAVKVVGNIPYYITSPLIDKALTPPLPTVVVFLVQKEVADRVTAAPGSKTYGALSVGVQAVARAERLFVVRAGAFSPPPDVHSAVLRLTPRGDALVSGELHPRLRAFLAQLFSQRRKQLGRSLRDISGLQREVVLARLAEVNVDPAARPESLDPGRLVALWRTFMR